MTFDQLSTRLKSCGLGHKVLLGIGPMSKNTVDAILDAVNVLKVPIQIIASRRQIDCEELGGGYVNNWTTETFAKYVRAHDTAGTIMLCRDHGGPWQGAGEDKLSPNKAFEKACISYEADIRAGFDVIHLDPSLHNRPLATIKHDVERLLTFCEGVSGSSNVTYECGTEETNGQITDSDAFEDFVRFCAKLSPKIKFCVGQTGTLVKETRNVGIYDNTKARELVNICNTYGMLLKEHNLDYAHDEVLKDHHHAGIHSVNIAPEFGVLETIKLLELLDTHKLKKERKRFIQIAHNSKKWVKWLISEHTDEYKAIICGHYVFTDPEVMDIKNLLSEKMYLDDVLKTELTCRLLKYLKDFRWLV
jgi:tagatose-1,6-bisphosphate aldolase non-catalytic subunit AgaZ/GatZ